MSAALRNLQITPERGYSKKIQTKGKSEKSAKGYPEAFAHRNPLLPFLMNGSYPIRTATRKYLEL